MAELDLQQHMVKAAKERSSIAKALLAIQQTLDKMGPAVSKMEYVLDKLEPAVTTTDAPAKAPPTGALGTKPGTTAMEGSDLAAPTPTNCSTKGLSHDVDVRSSTATITSTTASELLPATTLGHAPEFVMLEDTKATSISPDASVFVCPNAKLDVFVCPNAKLDAAYKLFDEKPLHADVDLVASLQLDTGQPIISTATGPRQVTNHDLGAELRPRPWPSFVCRHGREHFVHLHVPSGLQRYIWRVRQCFIDDQQIMVQEGRLLLNYVTMNAIAIRKILKKYDKIHGSVSGRDFKSKMQTEHIELLQSPSLIELGAFHLNCDSSDTDEPVGSFKNGFFKNFPCDLTGTQPIMTMAISETMKCDYSLTCPICLDTLFNPYALSCCHLFCKGYACGAASVYIFQGVRSAPPEAKCPGCREVGVFAHAVHTGDKIYHPISKSKCSLLDYFCLHVIDKKHKTEPVVGCMIFGNNVEKDIESDCKTLVRCCPNIPDVASVDRVSFLGEMIVSVQVHYSNECSIPDSTFLITMTECSAIELRIVSRFFKFGQSAGNSLHPIGMNHLVTSRLNLHTVRLLPWDPGGCAINLGDMQNNSLSMQRIDKEGRALSRETLVQALHLCLCLPCDPGDSKHGGEQDTVKGRMRVPGDPGRLSRRRLEGKPNFKGEGMSWELHQEQPKRPKAGREAQANSEAQPAGG